MSPSTKFMMLSLLSYCPASCYLQMQVHASDKPLSIYNSNEQINNTAKFGFTPNPYTNRLAYLSEEKSLLTIINVALYSTPNPYPGSKFRMHTELFWFTVLRTYFQFWDESYNKAIYFNQVNSASDVYSYMNVRNPTQHATNQQLALIIIQAICNLKASVFIS